jgi:DeoR family deoxyribose operon repressor
MEENEAGQVIAARREQRLGRLRHLVREQGALRLAAAARELGVSPMTLRRDLARGAPGVRDLALLGGHVTAAPLVHPSPAAPSRYVLDREQKSHAAAKREAARHAARLVAEGDTVFIDCGTTLPHLVTALPAGMPLTIVCYALNIASLAAQRPNTQLLLLGGVFHPSSATFYAEDQVERLRRLGINIGFFSAGGAHVIRGASCSNFHEVAIKQAALAAAMRRHLVVDAAKLGRVKPAFFAPLSAFDSIITDARITSEARAGFRAPPLDPAPG